MAPSHLSVPVTQSIHTGSKQHAYLTQLNFECAVDAVDWRSRSQMAKAPKRLWKTKNEGKTF